jgi:uncharacterized protein (TIGR02099 family)
MRNIIHGIWTQLWLTGVVCLVLLALYTSLGRQLIPLIETKIVDIENELTAQLGTRVTIGSLEGGWIWFSPKVTVNDLVIGDGENKLEVTQLDAELDVSASLFYRVPVFDTITLSGVHLPLVQDESLSWRLGDFLLNSNTSAPKSKHSFGQGDKPLWLKLLGRQGEIHLSNWHIDIQRFEKPIKAINLLDIRLRNNGLQHWLDGEIQLVESGAILKTQLEVEGDLWDISQHNGKGFLELETQSWQDWIPEYQSQWQVQEVSLGAKLWVDVKGGLIQTLDGYINIPDFALTKNDNDQTRSLAFEKGRVILAGRRDGQDWHLWFDSDLNWMSGHTLPKPKGRISWLRSVAGGFQLALNGADLEATANWLEGFKVFDPVYMDYITNLKPQGSVERIIISVIPELDWLWEASFDLKNTRIQGWQGIPAAQQLNAHVKMNAQGGLLKIQNNNTYLHFANVYEKGWMLENTTADLFWKINNGYLKISSPNISAVYKNTDLVGAFSFYTPFNGNSLEPQLNLMLGLKNLAVDLQSELVPHTIPETVSGWLNENLKSGIAEQASFIFSGSLAEDSSEITKTIQVYSDVKNAQVSYMPNWPEVENINASLMVDVPNVDIWVKQASTLGGKFIPNSSKLSIHNDNNNTWLTINGKIKGPAAESIKYLQDTPLKEALGNTFKTWSATGEMTSELFVEVLLNADKTTAPDDLFKIRLESDLDNVELQLTDLDLSFSNIDGTIVFDNADGLSAKKIKAHTFSGDVTADIISSKQNDGFDITVSALGNAQVDDIKQRLPLFIMKPISGKLDYQLDLLIRPLSRGGLKLTMNSELLGTQIETPSPFGKSADQKMPFQLGVNQNKDLRINFRYGDLTNGVIALEEGELTRGQIYLGTAQAYLPSDNGLSISGNLDYELDAKAWWDLWNDIRPSEESKSTGKESSDRNTTGKTNNDEQKPALLTHINISVPAINAWQQAMGPTHIEGNHEWGQWLFNLDSQLVTGQIIMPDDLENKVIELNLKYIHMPVSDTSDTSAGVRFGSDQGEDALADFDPAWIPKIDLKVDEVFLGTSNFGRWDLSVRNKNNITKFRINDSLIKSMNIKGDVDWTKSKDGHKTHLNLMRLTSKKLGDVQRDFRKAAAIEAKNTKIDLDLMWDGSPARFNYASLNGLAKVSIKDGVLISDNAGALKAFGVLNFNTISRRLQLDFSDLYEKGVVFDVLKTRLEFEDGIATFVEPLLVDGPSAKFQSSGLVNFNTDEIDQKMIVTFPVASSLPLVAVLAGLAPQIAGAIYVTEKLIGDELERFTSASYSISGTIGDPKLDINKAFDNKLKGKETRSFKDRFLDIFGLGGDE